MRKNFRSYSSSVALIEDDGSLMGTSVIIVAISSMTAIIVAALTYYTTKQREREAEWRKEKVAHYKDFFAALAETIGPHVSDDARAIASHSILSDYSLLKM